MQGCEAAFLEEVGVVGIVGETESVGGAEGAALGFLFPSYVKWGPGSTVSAVELETKGTTPCLGEGLYMKYLSSWCGSAPCWRRK